MTTPTNGTQAPASGGVRVQMLWHSVRRHPIAVMLLVLLAGGAAAGAWFFLPLPKLTGVSVYHVASQPPALIHPTSESRIEFTTYKTMQLAMIKQRIVLNDALKQPEMKDVASLNKEPDRIAYLERVLQVDFRLGPEFMRVTVEGDDDGELINILTAVSRAYLAQVNLKDNGARERRHKDLTVLRNKLEAELQAYQLSLTGLAGVLQSTDPAVLHVMEELAAGRLKNLQDDILRNERELKQADRDSQFFKEKAEQTGEIVVSKAEVDRAIDSDERVFALEKAVALARNDVEVVDKQLKDKNHTRLVSARKELAALEAELARYREELRPKAAETLKQKLTQDRAMLASKNAERAEALKNTSRALEKALGDISAEISTKSRTYLQLETVKKQIVRTEKLYEQIVLELQQLDLERGAPLRVTESERPYVMTGIEGNRRLKVAMMAAGGVLLLGLVGLVFWESRNRMVLAVEDVGKELGLRVFGTVPPATSSGGGQSPAREAAVTEAIDTARTMLLYGSHAGPPPRTVLVTSALAGEGKTSLSGHLAISLARAGYRTLLIDADLRNPSNHRIFDIPLGPGLCELLRGEAHLEETLRPAPFANLSVLPAGQWSMAATQALAGDKWAAVRACVEAEFDFVVIDSAPVLPVVDSLLLARHVDGVLMSVLHDHSRVSSVAECQHRLQSIGANLLGVVLNGFEQRGGKYGYAAYGYPVQNAEPLYAEAV